MKDIFAKIRTFSIYKNMLLVYLTSVITVVVLIIIASYGIFFNYTKQQTAYYLNQLMGQITNTFSSTVAQIQDVQSSIIDETYFNRYVTYKTPNKIINYELFFRLIDIQSYYSFIENISIVNLEKNDIISSQRSITNDQDFARTNLPKDSNSMKIVYREKEFEYNSIRYTMDVISAIKYLPEYNTAIITDIPLETLRYSKGTINEFNRLNTFYLVDDTSQIISPEYMDVDVNNSEHILNFLAAPSSYPTFVAYEAKQAYFFSQPVGLSCWLVGVQDSTSIYRQYQQYNLYFVLLSALLAAIGSVLFWKNTNRAFTPLTILLEKYQHALPGEFARGTNEYVYLQKIIDQMTRDKHAHEAYIRQEIIKNLLTQKASAYTIPKELTHWYKTEFLHPYYYVLVFHICIAPKYVCNSSDLNILRFSLRNISEELFSSEANCFSTDIDSAHVAIILALDLPVPLNCSAKIKQIHTIFNHSHLELKASLGHLVDVQGLPDSYNRAIQYLKLNFHYDVDGFVDSNQYLEDQYLDKNIHLNHQIMQYLETHYMDVNLSINMVAQEMHLSSTYTGKIFKAINDIPFSNFLSEFRLEKSKLLLQDSGDTINDISEKIGFANSTYYTTLFKKKYGCTPSQYRSAQRKKDSCPKNSTPSPTQP